VLPGMTDSHHHLEGVGFREMTLNLEGITNLQDFLAKVKAKVDQTKPGEWVTGRGWIETFWQPPVFPTRWDLDKVSPNNPVILQRADGHGTVVNSAALKIAGIPKILRVLLAVKSRRTRTASQMACCSTRRVVWCRNTFRLPHPLMLNAQSCWESRETSAWAGRRSRIRVAAIRTLMSTKALQRRKDQAAHLQSAFRARKASSTTLE